MCFWRYTQVCMREFEAMAYEMANSMMQNNNMMNNNNMMMPNANPNMMMNLASNKGRSVATNQDLKDDGQKSLAQLARAAFGRLR